MSGNGTKKNAAKASDADREEADICPANEMSKEEVRRGEGEIKGINDTQPTWPETGLRRLRPQEKGGSH
jgi:hypothetical protein